MELKPETQLMLSPLCFIQVHNAFTGYICL